MPLKTDYQGYTIYHECSGVFSQTDFQKYLEATKKHYHTVGDAIAIINDVRQLRRVSLPALHYVSTTMSQLHLPVFPAAFVGRTDSLIFNLAMSIAKFASATSQIAFLDDPEQATSWIEGWFANRYKDGRESVAGRIDPLGYEKKQKKLA